MKYYITILILLLSLSCKNDSESDPKIDKSVEMFGIINFELNNENERLKRKIDSTSIWISDSLKVDYIDHTKQYLAFIENLKKQFASKNKKEIINFSDKEKKLTKETYVYKNKVLELTENEELKNRINHILEITDVTNENGDQVKFFNYIFGDKSRISSITYLTLKENQILQLTVDYLNDNSRKNLQPTSVKRK